ncbi:neutral zinc metallopeptidase [Plantactinospora siamensis]|uniref:Neutral zinc metallopeptidase n=1 Tax=Plantactinospora siamensis TaxID=555372 RepID=A0ABV6P2U2_9ACTN
MQPATRDRSGPVLRLAALLSALVVALACGAGTTPDGGGGDRPAAGRSSAGRSSPPQGRQEDGTMTIGEFKSDLNGAVDLAEQYWGARFQQNGQRFQPVRRVVAYQRTGEVSCAGQGVPRNNALYCSDGDFIAYDVNWAVQAFRKIGDAFLYYLLGHEYAHGIQTRLGIRYSYTIQQELQADCMAGAYIGDSVKDGDLDLQDGDLDELRRGLAAVADDPGQPWFAEGAHGSAKQRTDSFFNGYQRSLAACDLGR